MSLSSNDLPLSSSTLNLTSSLCFSKDIFYAQTFDIDAFLAHYKREYSLERLRDDLIVYLKVLELSMSELINKDYPDFVNLSTNLVDLDKGINELKKPLETLKNEIDSVRGSIDSEIEKLMSKLNEKLSIEKRKIFLKLLMNWQRSLKITNEMIGNNSENAQKITGDYIERVAFEFCQLKNSLSICNGENKDSIGQNNDIIKLSEVLEKIMKDLFFNCLNINNRNNRESTGSNSTLSNIETRQQLKHVLKSYTLLLRQRLVEQLFADYCVKPYLNEFINESYLESNIQKLNGVYEKVLDFLDLNSDFLKCVCEINQNLKEENSFDFLLNSLWSSVVNALDLDLNIVFSPADPDLFHKNYTQSFEFLSKFEAKCLAYDKDFRRKLLSSQSYKYFLKKWPIQVYYQIRFQEIVTKFEEELLDSFKLAHEQGEFSAFYLNMSEILLEQLEYCWSEEKNCFLKCLLSQFWKLSMQLISRYCSYFIELYQNKVLALAKSSNNNGETSSNIMIGLSGTESSTNRPRTPNNDETVSRPLNINMNNSSKGSLTDLDFCVMLLADAGKLYSIRLPNFFDGCIAPILRSANATKSLSELKEAFNCSLYNLNELQLVLQDFVCKHILEKCLANLKSVHDIPRLYRRTNRDTPKSASMYVSLAVDIVYDFKQTHSNKDADLIRKCIENIVDSLCLKYQSMANDLLESVKKMEDSLRRLQRVRQSNKSVAGLSSLTSGGSGSMSDDDKIRLQLYLDVLEFGQLLAEKFDGYNGETNFQSLFKLVEEIGANVSNSQKTIHHTEGGAGVCTTELGANEENINENLE